MHYYIDVWKKYAVFEGRARRAEYWYFMLFNIVIVFALLLIVYLVSPWVIFLYWLYALAIILPEVGVGIRRLHDTDRRGWWLLLGLIPIVGQIILLIWLATDSQPGTNRYGQNPKVGE